jgi:tetratricopeptide (TPR) repeat protein
MFRFLVAAVLATTCMTGIARGEECTAKAYGELVTEAKNADANRLWDQSVVLYRRILGECSSPMAEGDLAKLYDALAVALLMQDQYGEALDTAQKCIQEDGRYNACMMTAAKASESLGDLAMAEQFAREAIDVGANDDYSAAVVILAKDFLRKLQKK